jgi:hypothetical protein
MKSDGIGEGNGLLTSGINSFFEELSASAVKIFSFYFLF